MATPAVPDLDQPPKRDDVRPDHDEDDNLDVVPKDKR